MTTPTPLSTPSQPQLTQTLDKLGANWGWFVSLGIAQLILGLIALGHIFAATMISVLFIGVLMAIGGVGQLIQAWRIKRWAGFLLWTLSGLLYLAAGILAIVNPLAGASLFTLVIGATLIGTGALRLWLWFNNRTQAGWRWLAFSGLITLITGLLIAANWPGNSVWILGLLLGFDLLFQGWTLFFMGLALRHQRTR